MKRKTGKLLTASLVLVCILTVASLPQTLAGPQSKVYLKVMPQVVGAATPGETVVIDITINDLKAEDKLTVMEWKLKFNPDLLELSSCTEGDFLPSEAEEATTQTGDNYETYFGYEHDPGTDFVISFTLYYEYPWPPEVFPDGSGPLATMTFNAISIPEEFTEVDLTIFDVTMLDVDGNGIVYDHKEHGKYLVPSAFEDINRDGRVNIQDLFIFGKSFGSYPGHPRWDVRADVNVDGKVGIMDGLRIAKQFGKITTPKLFLEVEPEYSHVSVGEEFSIDITINDVEGPLNIVGVEWKLKFDTNILEILDVVEGDFLKSVAEEAGPDHGTYFWWIQEDNYVLSFTLLHREPWPPKMFPEGSGTLATITFRAIAEGTYALELDDVALAPSVAYHHLEDGFVIVR